MFVRAKRRFKDGKEHRYWSVVENCRNPDGRVVQRQVLYLGEINDGQRAAWCRSVEVHMRRTFIEVRCGDGQPQGDATNAMIRDMARQHANSESVAWRRTRARCHQMRSVDAPSPHRALTPTPPPVIVPTFCVSTTQNQ